MIDAHPGRDLTATRLLTMPWISVMDQMDTYTNHQGSQTLLDRHE